MYKAGLSTTTISTDSLSGCYAFLISGIYNGINFCYLNHQPWTPRGTVRSLDKLLVDLLERLAKEIKRKLRRFFHLTTLPSLKQSTTNLSLFVGGGGQLSKDNIREACLLLENNGSRANIVKLIDNDDTLYLYHQFLYRTTIIKPAAFIMSKMKMKINYQV